MKLTKIGLGIVSVGLLSAQLAFAEGPKLSGYIDTSLNIKISDDQQPYGNTSDNFWRSFDADDNTFLLNTAHLNVDGSSGKAGFHVGLDFGSDDANIGWNNIQEGYLTLSTHENCSLTAGKFSAIHGIEGAESVKNPTISRGYLFNRKPASLTGLKMDHQFGKVSLTLGGVNGMGIGTTTNDVDNNRDKMWFGKVGLNLGSPLAFGVSYYTGKETTGSYDRTNTLDLTGVSNLGPVAVNFQYNVGEVDKNNVNNERWTGYSIQPVYAFYGQFSIGARYEWLGYDNSTMAPKNAWNVTIAPTYKMSSAPVTVRAEYRKDEWDNIAGDKSSETVSGELIYNF
ncbi:MAG: porin [Nitrospirota bacterium]